MNIGINTILPLYVIVPYILLTLSHKKIIGNSIIVQGFVRDTGKETAFCQLSGGSVGRYEH